MIQSVLMLNDLAIQRIALLQGNVDYGHELIKVRLTPNEYSQVISKKVGDIFTHVNLQHSELHKESLINEYQLGVKILRNGNKEIQPVLDLNSGVLLQLIETKNSINVSSPLVHTNLLLHNNLGLLDSLVDRYSLTRGISREEITDMSYFYRVFRIIDFL